MAILRDAPSGPVAPASAMPPGVIAVPNLATLALLSPSTRVTDGCLAYVQILKRCFQLDRSSLEAPKAGQRVSATGGGVWRSMSSYTFQSNPWSSQTDWHIDAVNGTVEGDGSASSPISSWVELMTRINDAQLPPGVTISIHSDLAEYIDASRLVPDPSSGVVITGQPGATTLLSGAVTTYTNESTVAPGEAPKLTCATVADWTPYVAKRVRFTSGPAAGAYSSIAKENPNGAGLNVARIPAPVLPSFASPTFPVPLAGNTFVIEQLPSILGYVPPQQPGQVQNVTLDSFAFPEPTGTNRNRISGGTVILFGCTLGRSTIAAYEARLEGCRIGALTGNTSNYNNGNFYMYGCTLYYSLVDCWRSDVDHIVYQRGFLCYDGMHTIHHSGAFDSTSSGLIIASGGRVFLFGVFYGSGNAQYGIDVPNGMSGAFYSAKPVITGTINNFRLAGVAHVWADAPLTAANLAGIVTP